MQRFDGFPGAEIVTAGLRDLDAGRETVAALLGAVGAPRLQRLGIPVPAAEPNPEHRYVLNSGG